MTAGDHAGGYVIGVDVGTGSIKGVLTSATGRIECTVTRSHRPARPRPGWVEMDASGGWWTLVAEILRELSTAAGGVPILGVCVSGLGPSLVVTDDALRPRRPAILYGVDTRSGQEIAAMNLELGEDRILQRCGKHLTSQALGPKLRWIRDHEPEVWAGSTRWFSCHTYVVARLTGEWVIDHHTASQCDPLYDLARQDWATDWADVVLPGLVLPRLVWPSEVVGVVTAEAAGVTGLVAGTPVVAGTIDAWAEAFSVGVRRPGDLMLMYGSTMFLVQVLPAAAAYPGLWTTSGVEADSFTLAAGMATSGSLTTWFQSLTGDHDLERLSAGAAQIPPGADGLVLLPYFAGERSPLFDPDARGVLAGLTLNHGRDHIMRAIYEGVAYGIRHNLETLDAMVGPPVRAVAVGGGVASGIWPQIVSDVCNLPQVLPSVTTGASYGDALLAAIGVGLTGPETDWTVVEGTVEPDAASAAVYEETYAVYRDLYPATRSSVHRLAELQDRRYTVREPA
jgi:xylulokinase